MDLTTFTPSSALLTVVLLALAPFVAIMVTSFTKIVVVLSLLRNALGVQQVPPNLVLNGLAMILTIYVMYPVGIQMTQNINLSEQSIETTDGLLEVANQAKEPVRDFLIKHSNELERAFFYSTVQQMTVDDESPSVETYVESTDFVVLLPAFIISELSEAFQIGFLIYLPFIIIDLVVSNILMALGMMMLSPTIVSLPFKLLLFVMVDGWAKLSHGLVLSYLS
jgi:type III secretion protein R